MRATFPHLALADDVQIHLSGQSLEPRESIDGTETIVPTMRGRWMATASFTLKGRPGQRVGREAVILQWQAFLAQMQGRIGTTLVPMASLYRPKDRDGLSLPLCNVGGIEGAQTFEHFGFENTSVTRIALAEAAPLRASELSIRLIDSTGLRPGQFFSIGPRLHRVQLHWRPSANERRLLIEPPLRAAAAANTRLEIERPVCLMGMVSETEGLHNLMERAGTRVTVNFAERV